MVLRYKYILIPAFLVTVLTLNNCAHFYRVNQNEVCRDKTEQYIKANNALTSLYHDDQNDRKDFSHFEASDLARLSERDEKRRVKVAELFARGCLKSAEDYKMAALIFQHGTVAEHFYQAFVWARAAVRLGDNSAQHLVSLSIDRFLVNSGLKQLFGSQAMKPLDNPCWCLYPIEPSFTDQDRATMAFKPIAQQIEWLRTLNDEVVCPTTECSVELKAVKKNDFPEFW